MTKIQTYIILIIICIAIFIFWNKPSVSQDLPGSIGDPLELVVVYNLEDFETSFTQKLNQFLTTSMGPSPQRESLLNLIEVDQKKFTGILKRHQNILLVSKGESFSIEIKRNLFAQDQFVFFIQCPSLLNLNENKVAISNLVQKIKEIEVQRLSEKFISYSNISLKEAIQDLFGFSLDLPADFFLAYSDSSIVWARRETPKISQGVFISKIDNRAVTESRTLALIDSIIKPHISGPRNGSYMTIEWDASVKTETIQVGHRSATKIQSLWRMENDFMGGIFNAYNLHTDSSEKQVLVYTYLYAPGEKKNVLLIQLEAIINTLK